MHITVEYIYREIMTRLTTNGFNRPYDKDLKNAIREIYPIVRNRYLKAGMFEPFMVHETIEMAKANPDFDTDTLDITNFYRGELTEKVIDSIPVAEAFKVVLASWYPLLLRDETHTFAKDSVAVRDQERFAYIATDEITDINTYTKTFDPEDVRSFKSENGLKYKVDDIISIDDSYYRVVSEFTNDSEITDPDTDSNLDKMYWMRYGVGAIYPVVVPISFFTGGDFTVSTDRTYVYAGSSISLVSVSYIPEFQHEDLEFTTVLTMPDTALVEMRIEILRLLGYNIQPSMENSGQQDEQETKNTYGAQRPADTNTN